MRTFKERRTWAVVVTAGAGLLFLVMMLSYQTVLENTAFISGWILLSMMLLLALYNVRKKLTYPPLLKSATWLQFHVYIGGLCVLVFFVHTGWRMPNGTFEATLYILFISLAGSGILGIFLSRTMPKHLAGRGGEVIFERIPMFVRQLREQAEALVVESIQFNDSTILADFYNQKLSAHMSSPRRFGWHVFMIDRLHEGNQRELSALHRYLSEAEREVASRLSSVLDLKDDLDFHYSRQGMLKAWLFLHIPLTYAALLFTAVHLVLVHAFYGGLS